MGHFLFCLLILLILNGYSFAQCPEYTRQVHAWGEPSFTVFGCLFGSGPKEISQNRWSASGIYFFTKEGTFIEGNSEAGFDLEYYLLGDNLSILTNTYDPRSDKIVPIFKKTVSIKNPESGASEEVILSPPAPNPDRVDQILRILSASNEVSQIQKFVKIEDLLFELRNYGLANPKQMIMHLNKLRSAWWHDGHAAELVFLIIDELKRASKLQP